MDRERAAVAKTFPPDEYEFPPVNGLSKPELPIAPRLEEPEDAPKTLLGEEYVLREADDGRGVALGV